MSPPFSNLFTTQRTGDPGGPDWATGYLEASFRGVPFHIQGASYNTGRRNVKHVYPRQDVVDHEEILVKQIKPSLWTHTYLEMITTISVID